MTERNAVPKTSPPKPSPQKRKKSLMVNVLIACGIALASQSELNLEPRTNADTDSRMVHQKHQAPSRAGYVNAQGSPGMASRTEQGQPATPLPFATKMEQRQI